MSKVVCAMSGGVDSSVAAAILKKKGFKVIGVFMKFWSEGEEIIGVSNKCCFSKAEKRARRVAEILNIPFYVFNFEKEFKKGVIDYFLNGYEKGVTPNPCVTCNKKIKFGLLLEKALSLGADFVATGHYARLREKLLGNKIKKYKLLRAKDKKKDQSYFLWTLNQKQLKKVLFPIGDYSREEVKDLAKHFHLPVLRAKKSVEICFVQGRINDFLKNHLREKRGNIVDTNGKILGKHGGLWFYTIGQRKGIGLSGGPYFVLKKSFKNNLLIVTKNEKDLFKKELVCSKINWLSGNIPKFPAKMTVQIRYQARPVTAIASPNNKDELKIQFSKPVRGVTPGQSVVFYKKEEVLGGGIILE